MAKRQEIVSVYIQNFPVKKLSKGGAVMYENNYTAHEFLQDV